MFLPLKNEKYFFRISNNLPRSFQDISVDRAESWELLQTQHQHPVWVAWTAVTTTVPPAGWPISKVRAVQQSSSVIIAIVRLQTQELSAVWILLWLTAIIT